MDEHQLRELITHHHAASYGWALACGARQGVEAEDVLQSAYLKILSGKARFDARSAFRTWLFAVIRRTALEERRGRWLRRLRLAARAGEPGRNALPDHPEALAEQSESARRFRALLDRLPERQREVLHLVFYQDLSIEETAAIVGVSPGSARTHYTRGKERLRQWLAEIEVVDARR